jgi:lipid-A-disaccharide synthase
VVFSPNVTAEAQKKFKQEHNLHDGPIITILPGSRISEINRMCPIFDKVASNIQKLYPNVQFILPVALTVEENVLKAVSSWDVKPLLLLNRGKNSKQIEYDKFITYSISSVALATSGTVALELAAKKCPMVIAYKANWLTTKMVKRLAKIDTANLINIITNTKVIPEHLFEDCTAEKITNSLKSLLNNDNNQISAMSEAMSKLGIDKDDNHLLAAKSVLKVLK